LSGLERTLPQCGQTIVDLAIETLSHKIVGLNKTDPEYKSFLKKRKGKTKERVDWRLLAPD
jgi:hypothetical protein